VRVSGSFGFHAVRVGSFRIRATASIARARRCVLASPGRHGIWEFYPISAGLTTAIDGQLAREIDPRPAGLRGDVGADLR
jgi:hypothetical protein